MKLDLNVYKNFYMLIRICKSIFLCVIFTTLLLQVFVALRQGSQAVCSCVCVCVCVLPGLSGCAEPVHVPSLCFAAALSAQLSAETKHKHRSVTQV